MAKSRFRIYLEKDKETGLVAARCLEIGALSQGKNEKDALKNIWKAIKLHVETIDKEVAGKKLVEVEI
ncbi:MAG: type II toxin-antitoxin system HicB family antitoxin [Thaumarchaeota archaeon]|nr:type II toxin-antitoxin system HicB family antitoxin [Nitrososphaerota archaeon]